ncbi:Dihydroorotate dehydrogenase B (NAD(+)), catalytic subunit [Pseudobythopirellula maris]|uniref:Dihydroorotate dehydrogenase n=1 Tax=Pseudobythopirellula maris TaxID=2527991 RepID=A0A5C5ZTP0_9BACT|nr:dihydroorotate dehydrogenase [Pseudobythopirellula maris]TWT90455.1 Dihydroorotate dehydrogenase B (NAD(+)), catalytic subunit [Pseudobythopirellula maris]
MSLPAPPAPTKHVDPASVDLKVELGRLTLPNPVLVASGTFGYAREMAAFVDLTRLGGVVPKTITQEPRQGNAPWRTVETAAGMLNSIGLDNDGLEAFLAHHLPYLASLGAPVVVSVAGRTHDEFVAMCRRVGEASAAGPAADAIELNISCPNVSHGVDFGVDPARCEELVRDCRLATELPIVAKLTPNVTSVATMAKAAEAGGADAIALINTCLGMAVDWRRRRPLLGNVVGGLSGPAIKPIALRCVWQAAQAVRTPIVGVGGVATLDDTMEFLVAGASAVQLGTVNFYRPTASMEVLDALPAAIASLGAASVAEVVASLTTGLTTSASEPQAISPSPSRGGG